jgi:hypothetical protein
MVLLRAASQYSDIFGKKKGSRQKLVHHTTGFYPSYLEAAFETLEMFTTHRFHPKQTQHCCYSSNGMKGILTRGMEWSLRPVPKTYMYVQYYQDA